MAMANITVPIQVNLPDDWIEQIVNRLRNDPKSEWVEIVRCKDCKHYKKSEVAEQYMCYRKDVEGWSVCYDFMPTDFCKYGERRTDETD